MIRLLSEETIEEGIYSIAQDKLKLEQDLNASDEDKSKSTNKKDLKKLLKIALEVELDEAAIGEVDKIYTDL